MANYRKRPIIIQAFQLTELNIDEIRSWCNGRTGDVIDGITIPTMEGDMIASNNDYVIKGIKGEFYPCKPDIFEATYELVD